MRTLSAAIVDYSEGFSGAQLRADLFAFGVILFVSTAIMTLGAKLIAIPIERRLQGRAVGVSRIGSRWPWRGSAASC